MKTNAYSIVYSGLAPEPYYAAAASETEILWAAASGNEAGGPTNVIRNLEKLAEQNPTLTEEDLTQFFAEAQSVLQSKKMAVSAAGAFSDGETLHPFNIGSARVLVFKDGYLTAHSDDHTTAYEAYKTQDTEDLAAYDAIRSLSTAQTLRRWIGLSEDTPVQFYPPVVPERGTTMLICTDNLWRFLSIMEMELDYRKAANTENWLKIMARRVLMNAGSELDNQNFAAIAVTWEE